MRGEKPTPERCEQCLPPVDDENVPAARLWPIVSSQVLVGPSGQIIGINQLAVWTAIEKYKDVLNIMDEQQTFEDILMIFNHFQEIQIAVGGSDSF